MQSYTPSWFVMYAVFWWVWTAYKTSMNLLKLFGIMYHLQACQAWKISSRESFHSVVFFFFMQSRSFFVQSHSFWRRAMLSLSDETRRRPVRNIFICGKKIFCQIRHPGSSNMLSFAQVWTAYKTSMNLMKLFGGPVKLETFSQGTLITQSRSFFCCAVALTYISFCRLAILRLFGWNKTTSWTKHIRNI